MRADVGVARPANGPLKTLFRLRTYARPYARSLLALLVCAALGQAFQIVGPLLTQRVIDGPVRHGTTDGLLPLAGLALLASVCVMISDYAARRAHATGSVGVETALRTDLYAHLQRLPLEFHDRWPSGQLLSRSTSDLRAVGSFLAFGSIFIVLQTGTFVGVAIILMTIHWPLGLLVTAGMIPVMVLTYGLSRSYLPLSRRLQDDVGDLTSLVEESVLGFRTIRAFGRHRYINQRFGGAARTVLDTGLAQGRVIARFWPAIEAVPGLLMAAVLLGGAYAVAGGSLTIGELVAFIGLLTFAIWPLDSLGWLLGEAQQAATAAQRVYEILDTPPTVVDRPDARTADSPKGHVRFEGVGFRYPTEDSAVLHDVDLEVRPGETMALVGASGSGKTTLTLLVNRLYDVTAGRITVDGVDIRDLSLESLRTVVSSAFEDPTLFSASVRENITLGRPDATDDEVAAALRIAQAEFVHDLPWGLDTRIGEKGLSLSGGQRQRLALARAVVGRPRVLVLDDPLSALDVETEAMVEQALHTVLAGTTALLVVHRPSTVALADRVALIDDGTVVAVGTHEELLATVPTYRDLLDTTLQGAPQ
ncbi:ABC transporter ATP-binding protein [Cryptosporangium aurantiacum]|uniref:ATP-binding cassette, subfamily B n=1 Tax=Cryptosporangium aurantiacum TaxID=134849 RepID=A0A1M7QRJ7_9ACTN|nr:ABC transporter ATP-binding protein [Cryptosporangium aurantiacum]SHN34174.1 ATP-binding cassette, subfamily B [Cryptosporangium aurantiacum]